MSRTPPDGGDLPTRRDAEAAIDPRFPDQPRADTFADADEAESGSSQVADAASADAGSGAENLAVVYHLPRGHRQARQELSGDDATDGRREAATAVDLIAAEPAAGGGPGAASRPPDGTDLDEDEESADEPTADSAGQGQREEWAWVREWRDGDEPTPWATGVPLAVFAALVVGVAIWVLSAGLADRPIVAVLVNLLVAAGLAPAMWLSRGLPVLRWVAAGAAAGIVIGWISAMTMLSLPV